MCKTNVDTDALVRKYEPLIHSVIVKKLPAHLGDDDLVQVGRLALWRCSKRYDPDKGRFSTYAYKAIYHAMLKELGKRKNDVSINMPVVAGEEEVELQDTIPDLSQNFDGVELKLELEDFYKTLTPRRQEVLRRKANGETRREIAQALGVSYQLIVLEMQKINKQWKAFHNNVEEEENED